MRPRLMIPALLSAALAAQMPPAVKIVLQVDPPKDGAPALSTAAIAKALAGLAKDAGLVEPMPGGDGWVLEMRAVPMKMHNGLLIADTPMRLSRIQGGQKVVEGAKDAESVAGAMTAEDLDANAGADIAARAQMLLEMAKVIPLLMPPNPPVTLAPGSGPSDGKIDDFDFAEVRVVHQPPRPPYPPAARMNRVQGDVVVELVIRPDGSPASAIAEEGPDPLLAYALEFAMNWRFEPLHSHGKPVWGRFKIHMQFRLR